MDMPKIKTRDGMAIFCRDRGDGPPVVFAHGWPPKICDGGDHGLPSTHQDQFNADLPAFLCGAAVPGSVEKRSRADA